MFENIRAGDNAARAVTKHVDRQARVFCPCDLNQLVDITGIVRKLVDVKTLAVRTPATSEIERISRQSMRGKLFARPCHISAMGVKSVDQGDHRPRRTLRFPRARENVQTVRGLE